jgi:hypothetical protein
LIHAQTKKTGRQNDAEEPGRPERRPLCWVSRYPAISRYHDPLIRIVMKHLNPLDILCVPATRQISNMCCGVAIMTDQSVQRRRQNR